MENMDWPSLGQRPIFRAMGGESATLMVLQRRLECRNQRKKEGRPAGSIQCPLHLMISPKDAVCKCFSC